MKQKVYEERVPKNKIKLKVTKYQGFPGGSVVKNSSASAGDMCSIPDLGRSHALRTNNSSAYALEPRSHSYRPTRPGACALRPGKLPQ